MMLSEKTGNWYFPQKFTNLFSFHKKSLPIQSLSLTWVYTLARRALAALPFKVPDGNRDGVVGELQHGRIILLQHMFEKRVLTLFSSLENQMGTLLPSAKSAGLCFYLEVLTFLNEWTTKNATTKMQEATYWLEVWSAFEIHITFTRQVIFHCRPRFETSRNMCHLNTYNSARICEIGIERTIGTTPSEWCVEKKLAACKSVTCTFCCLYLGLIGLDLRDWIC